MIPIKNLYYMLSYAFQLLNEQGYKNLATEEFKNAGDLCAAILIRGISYQLKRGLGREYISETDTISETQQWSEDRKQPSVVLLRMTTTEEEALNELLYEVALFNFSQFLIRDFDLQKMPVLGKGSALRVGGFQNMGGANGMSLEELVRQMQAQADARKAQTQQQPKQTTTQRKSSVDSSDYVDFEEVK